MFGDIDELKLQRGFEPTPTLELAPTPLTALLSLLKHRDCHFDFWPLFSIHEAKCTIVSLHSDIDLEITRENRFQ